MSDFSKLCNSRMKKGCCTNSSEPLIFSSDLKRFDEILSNKEQYLREISIEGKNAIIIKKKKNSKSCVFWDDINHNCSIYDDRPFDCRAYPFDILLVNGKFHWIVYSCNVDSDWKWTEQYLESLENDTRFKEVLENLDVFSGNTERILPNESQKTPYKILREIRLTNTIK